VLPHDEQGRRLAHRARSRGLIEPAMLDTHVAQALARSDKRIVVTGAGGWLGLATLDALAAVLGDSFASRVVAFGSVARTLHLRDGLTVEQQPLADLSQLSCSPTWLLHFAFLTKDRAETMDEATYRAANAAIRAAVLTQLDHIGAEAVFVASSGAAYKAQDPAASAAMRLYGELKAEDEAQFAAWGAEAGKRVVIARIFNVTGPYINKHQAYALASFILDGIAGRAIEVQAPRRVVRGYVPIAELVSLALAEMAAAPTGTMRFDTGGEPLDLGEVAGVVASHFPGLSVQRASIVDPQADIYHGDAALYASLLERHSIAPEPLRAQVGKTIDYLNPGQ
jgi:UDP-glucuronate decarboxylase